MNKNMKRAFTITELVIVIAVVAILAAVLIPTFSNLIEKANVSNDTVLVRNLNEALIIAETTEGKPQTMHDALTAVAEQGYTVEKLTPRSTGDILWEQTSNRFALVKDNEIVFGDDSTKAEIGYTYWKITSDLEEVSTGKYSYYLAEEVDESVLTEALAVSTGLDVGNNSNVSISYANNEASATAQNVIFRTNGGKLSINGLEDTVSHYGTANSVEITAVKGESYHEYGTILGNISLKQGRVVLENKSEVSSVVVTADNLTNIAIEDKSGNNTTVAATNDTVAGQLATSDKISGTTNVQETVVDETQMSLFAGGLGTEASPYLIETFDNLVNLGNESIQDQMTKGNQLHFKLVADIDLTDFTGDQIANAFCGSIDGNNHSITSSKNTYTELIVEGVLNVTIKNLSVIQHGEGILNLMVFAGWDNALQDGYKKTGGNFAFENIKINPYNEDTLFVTATNSSAFISQINYGCFVKFENCENNVNIDTNSNYAGIFLGGYAYSKTVIQYINCVNTATVTGNAVGFFSGNTTASPFVLITNKNCTINMDTRCVYAYVEGCRNDGELMGSLAAGAFSKGSTSRNEEFNKSANDALTSSNFIAGTIVDGMSSDTKLVKTENSLSIVVDESNIAEVTYKVSYRVSTSYYKADGTQAGTSYVWITLPEITRESAATWNEKYISKVILSTVFATPYNEIQSEEQIDDRGHKYKIVEENGSYVVVVDYDSLLEGADRLNVGDNGSVKIGGDNGWAKPTYTLIGLNDKSNTISIFIL